MLSRDEFIAKVSEVGNVSVDEGRWVAVVSGTLAQIAMNPEAFVDTDIISTIQTLAAVMPTSLLAAGVEAMEEIQRMMDKIDNMSVADFIDPMTDV